MDADDVYGDSDFLAERDKTVHDFRASDKETKHKIIEKMLTLRHNMKYNKHLLSVYMRAKGIFDTMVDEHRSQVEHLDEIYRHLNNLIRENLSAQRNKPADTRSKLMMTELVRDKKRIGGLLKKMRASFDKLMDIDTVIGVTIDQINKLTFMEDHADAKSDDDSDSEAEDEPDADEDEDEDEDEDDEDDEDDEHEDDEDEDEDDDDEDEDESDSESEDEPEPEDDEGEDEEPEDDEDEDDEHEPEDDDEGEDDEDESDSESEDEPEDEDEIEDEGDDSEPEDEDKGDAPEPEAKKPVIYVF